MTTHLDRAGTGSVLALGLLGLFLPGAASVSGQQAPTEAAEGRLWSVGSVTLDEALERAVARSPQMARGEAALGNARATRRTAVGSFLPSLSVGSGASVASTERFDPNAQRTVSGSSDSYNAALSASNSLYDGGRRFSEMDRAASELSAARAGLEDRRAGVVLDTKNLFYAALEQHELLEVARSSVRRAEERSPVVRSASASAAAAGSAVSSAEASYLPSLNLSSGYTWNNQDATFSGGRTSWSLRLQAIYPLFDGFSRSASVDRARDQARADEVTGRYDYVLRAGPGPARSRPGHGAVT